MPVTPNFGFTRVRRGESLAKNGFAALDSDRVTLDAILFALASHEHDDGSALTGPTGPPTLTVNEGGGNLPPGTNFFYRVSHIDRWGLETEAGPEAQAVSPSSLDRPSGVVLDVLSGGNLPIGRHGYAITYVDLANGRETGVSAMSTVSLSASSGRRVQVTFDEPPEGTAAVVYRMRPGQTRLFHLATLEEENTSFVDDGSLSEDQTRIAPRFNTTGHTASVTVDIGSLPEHASGWRIYRTSQSGNYSPSSLVATVVQTEEETGGPIVTEWTDDGSGLFSGHPREASSSMGGGKAIELGSFQGRFPHSAMPRGATLWSPSAPSLPRAGVIAVTTLPAESVPTTFEAYLHDPPEFTDATLRLRVRSGDQAFDLWLADGQRHARTQLPGLLQESIEAELADRSAAAWIITDPLASAGQKVQLTQGEYVEYTWELDPGTYQTAVILGGDGTVNVTVDAGTPIEHVLSEQALDEFPGPTFEVSEAGPFTLRVERTDSTESVYVWVDVLAIGAQVPVLPAGEVQLTSRLVPDSEAGNVSSAMAGYALDTDAGDLITDLDTLAGGGTMVAVAIRGEDELSINVPSLITDDTLVVAQGALTASSAQDRRLVQRAIESALGEFFFQDGDDEVDLRDVLSVSVAQSGTNFETSFTLAPSLLVQGADVYHVPQGPDLGQGANVSVWF